MHRKPLVVDSYLLASIGPGGIEINSALPRCSGTPRLQSDQEELKAVRPQLILSADTTSRSRSASSK